MTPTTSSTVKISIIIPCYNEVKYISQCLDSIIANDFPKENLEILVYDGGSTDRTIEILNEYKKSHTFLQVKHNLKKIQSAAMNLGIKEATGDIIIRMDAHTVYDNDYISQVVNLLSTTNAVNVGGPQIGIGNRYITKSIAITISSPFVAGNAFYRFEKIKERYVDTVYLGAWRKKDLLEIGGFDESFAVNEDYELNYRLRAKGGKILFSPKIKSEYFVRASFVKLIKQYLRYGFWKVKTLRKHPKSLALRQLAAPLFLLSLVIASVLFLAGWPLFLQIISIGYTLAFLFFAFSLLNLRKLKYLPLFFVFALTIHLCWGFGFWAGIIYWPWRKLESEE